MHLDQWRLRHPQHAIVVKVALHGTAILHRDLTIQRGARGPDDGTLDLRSHGVRVHQRAAIEGAHDTIDVDAVALRDGDLGDFGDVRAVVIEEGDTTATP